MNSQQQISEGSTSKTPTKGFFGPYGGAFVPEMLRPNVVELEEAFLRLKDEKDFQEELSDLLTHYVGRPTPLTLANKLSKKYGSTIYLKREDLCHTGSHKIVNALGQILLAKKLNKKRIIAETGAGQHGVATATVCALLDLECIVYMGEVDYYRQAANVSRMKMLGAEVQKVTSGSKTLKDATNEAIRDWIGDPSGTYYLIGSVVGPHPYPMMVAHFQSVISRELQGQLDRAIGRPFPDVVIACVGGGSNAIGAFYEFLDRDQVQLIGVEAAGKGLQSGESAATLSLGRVGVIHGSKTILMQDEDGQITEPHSISAGLDYPGIGPQHAYLFESGRVSYVSATDEEALTAGKLLTRLEGIIPALESAHAIAHLEKFDHTPEKVIVVNLSGRGDKDLETYGDSTNE